jgi:hypothetical protein
MPELHHAHTALQETPRDERLACVNALTVELSDVLRLFRDIKRVRRLDLHPKG